MVAELWREYRFRQLIPLSHEDFLNEPTNSIDWMLHMDNLRNEIETS